MGTTLARFWTIETVSPGTMRSGTMRSGTSNRGSLLYFVVESWRGGGGRGWWESLRKGEAIKRRLIMTRRVEGGRCSVRRWKQHVVELLMSELGNLELERLCPAWSSTIVSLELNFIVYIPIIPIRQISCNLRRRSGVRSLQGVRSKKIRGRRDWSGWKIRLCWMLGLGMGGVNTMIPWAEIYLLFRDPAPLIVTIVLTVMWRIEVVIVSLTSVYNRKTINAWRWSHPRNTHWAANPRGLFEAKTSWEAMTRILHFLEERSDS